MRKFMSNTWLQKSFLVAALLATAPTSHAALKFCRDLPLYGCDAKGCWNDPCDRGDGWVTIYSARTRPLDETPDGYIGKEKYESAKLHTDDYLVVVNVVDDIGTTSAWYLSVTGFGHLIHLTPEVSSQKGSYPSGQIIAAVTGQKKAIHLGLGYYYAYLTTDTALSEDVLKQAELTTTDYLPAWRDFNFNEHKYTVRDPDSSPFGLKMVEIIEYKIAGGAVRSAPRLDASGAIIPGPGDKMGLNEISTLQDLGNYDTCLVRNLATMDTLVCAKRPFRLSNADALPEVLPTTPPISPIPMPTCEEHCLDTPTTPGPAAPVEPPRLPVDGTTPSPKEPLGSSPKYPAPGTTLPGSPGPGSPPPSGA